MKVAIPNCEWREKMSSRHVVFEPPMRSGWCEVSTSSGRRFLRCDQKPRSDGRVDGKAKGRMETSCSRSDRPPFHVWVRPDTGHPTMSFLIFILRPIRSIGTYTVPSVQIPIAFCILQNTYQVSKSRVSGKLSIGGNCLSNCSNVNVGEASSTPADDGGFEVFAPLPFATKGVFSNLCSG